jgi:hypothetical protein
MRSIDDDGLSALAKVVADRLLHVQLATGSSPSPIRSTTDPTLLGHSGDRDETHASCMTDLQEDAANLRIATFSRDFSGELIFDFAGMIVRNSADNSKQG